jgi:hypothetical protein
MVFDGPTADIERVQGAAEAMGWQGQRNENGSGYSELTLQLPAGPIQQPTVDFMNRVQRGEFGKVRLRIIAGPLPSR